jgi:CRISPR-associated protein Cmr6
MGEEIRQSVWGGVMATPLYSEARRQAKPRQIFHQGLWWERFFDGYPNDAFGKPEQGKARFVESLAGECGVSGQLQAATERLCGIVYACGGRTVIYKTDWHFATGLGQEHPTENGFTWHRTLGAPYLPGSSVKGLVRGYLEWLHGIKADRPSPSDIAERLIQWFGSPHKDPGQWPKNIDSQAGWYIFFDALPIGPVKLAADVMTPHMGDWYEQGDDIGEVNGEPDPLVVPADWHSPNPVTFLAVREAMFQFGVAIRESLPGEQRDRAAQELDQVFAVLEDALQWAGAGAKTAAGYGRMSPDKKANRVLEKQREESALAEAPPEERLKKIIESWSEQDLAEHFGPDINKTRTIYGEEFDLLMTLALQLRAVDIERWKDHTKKTNKPRWKAYRNLTNPNSTGETE